MKSKEDLSCKVLLSHVNPSHLFTHYGVYVPRDAGCAGCKVGAELMWAPPPPAPEYLDLLDDNPMDDGTDTTVILTTPPRGALGSTMDSTVPVLEPSTPPASRRLTTSISPGFMTSPGDPGPGCRKYG